LQIKKFSKKEWEIIEALPEALTIRELAEKSGVPLATTWRLIKKLYGEGRFHFVVDFRKLGLSQIAVISHFSEDYSEWPYGTLSIRRLFGKAPYLLHSAIVPEIFVDKYVKSLNADVITVVRSLEHYKWKPNIGSLHLPEIGLIPLMAGRLWDMFFEQKNIKPPASSLDHVPVPDPIDLAILVKKIQSGPFVKPFEAIKYAVSKDPHFPLVSEKTVSYHYRKHVLPAWQYNTFTPYFPLREVPIRIYYFEGREAPAIARILVNLPYFITALIDTDKSLLTAQAPSWMEETIYQVISSFDVDTPLCHMVMSNESIAMFVPYLWRFLRRKGKGWSWQWIDEKVKVTIRQ